MRAPQVNAALTLIACSGVAVCQACPVGDVFGHPGLESLSSIEEYLTADADGDGAPT